MSQMTTDVAQGYGRGYDRAQGYGRGYNRMNDAKGGRRNQSDGYK